MAQVSGGGGSAESYVPEAERAAAMGSGGRFRIEPEAVERLAEGINQAMTSLDILRTKIDSAGQVAPPGTDPFSENATEHFRNAADGGPGALLAAHSAFKKVLEDTRDAIRGNARAAQQQDGSSASSITGGA